MARIVVGDWDCTFEEIVPLFKDPLILHERVVLSEFLGTSMEFMRCLEGDLEQKKIDSSDAMIQILVEWRSRNLKAATLGALLEIVGRRPLWQPIEDSIRNLLMFKAKSWLHLDGVSKDRILQYEVEFQGNMFALGNLKFLMNHKFDTFLESKVNQCVIHQVINGEFIRMQSKLEDGFITSPPSTTFSEPNKIKFESTKEFELGEGSGSTVVYKGTFGNVDVAVKKISNFRHHKEAENEIKFLVDCNGHQHIVRYFSFERHDDIYLLALELCHKNTLKDWIADYKCLSVEIDGLVILRQITDGLNFLHEENIIHRDLKPSNILFSIVGKTVLVRIADFGISRLLPQGESSKTVTSYGGSCGWTAAEMLEAKQIYNKTGNWSTPGIPKLTKKTDIFSLGCIYYVVLADGKHPFGTDETLIDHNIKKGNIQTNTNHCHLSLRCNISLVKKMIALKPEERPDTQHLLGHPIFWSYQKMINFISEVSNLVFQTEDPHVIDSAKTFQRNYFPKIRKENRSHLGWLGSLDDNVIRIFQDAEYDQFKYSAIKLVRLIRNLKSHYGNTTTPQAVRDVIGEKPQEYMKFWLKYFPTLINDLRDAFTKISSYSTLEQFYILKPDVPEKKKESVSRPPVCGTFVPKPPYERYRPY